MASSGRGAHVHALIRGASPEELAEIVRAALREMPEGLAVSTCADWAAAAEAKDQSKITGLETSQYTGDAIYDFGLEGPALMRCTASLYQLNQSISPGSQTPSQND